MKKILLSAMFIVGLSGVARSEERIIVGVSSHAFVGACVDSTTVTALPGAPYSLNKRSRILNIAVESSTSTIYFSTSSVALSIQDHGFPVKKDGFASIDLDPLDRPTTFFFLRKDSDGAGCIDVRSWLEFSR